MPLLILSAADVDKVIDAYGKRDWDDLIKRMAEVFSALSNAQTSVVLPHRISIPSGSHSVLVMPSRVPPTLGGTAVKVVSVPTTPEAAADGMPGSTAVIDERTGAVNALVNARRLTALRNAAGSALVTRIVGPATPQTLVAFGAGRQIQEHIYLFLITFPSIEHVTIINRSLNARLQSLLATLIPAFPSVTFVIGRAVSGEPVDGFNLEMAVAEADIICTATSSEVPLFKTAWVKPSAHLNLIGSYKPSMVEVESDLIRRAGQIVVDSRAACRMEAGELIQANLDETHMVEVGELLDLAGNADITRAEAVKRFGDVTIFKSVGVGLQDVAIAAAVVEQARRMGFGTVIPDYDTRSVYSIGS